MILKDIRENRIDNAICSTAHLFEDSYNDEKLQRPINHLVKEKSINEDQREALLNEAKLDLDTFIKQLKLIKVGRGIMFLPRLTNGLLDKHKECFTALKEDEMNHCSRKQLNYILKSILEELLQRRAISKQTFKDTIEEHELYK